VTVWTVPATITAVTDGDTLRASLDLGWKITYDAKIRLAGINCPEMNTPAGVAARAFTVDWLNAGTRIVAGVAVPAPVKVISHSLDKYGRVLGEVMRQPLDTPAGTILPIGGWESLSATLLAAGHAQVMK
jgi:endonuclease YncB( thermonuclease family)